MVINKRVQKQLHLTIIEAVLGITKFVKNSKHTFKSTIRMIMLFKYVNQTLDDFLILTSNIQLQEIIFL